MRITYISGSYVPSRRASAVHVMKMCAAFAQAGHSIELVAKKNPSRMEGNVDDVFRFYHVEPSFEILSLPRPSNPGGGALYGAAMAHLLHRSRSEIDLVYTRDPGGGMIAARLGLPFVYESHGVPGTRVGRFLLRSITRSRNLRRLVVISEALSRDLASEGLAPPRMDRTLVAHDASDPPRSDGRVERLEHPAAASAVHVGYVGNLYPGRGIEIVLELARRAPEFAFHVVGGTESDLARWNGRPIPANLKLHGFVAPSRVPGILRGFDILLMPHQHRVLAATGRSDISRWTSPLKMFEYMASGTPLIASRLPVLQEILEDGRNALLVEPDDVEGWAAALRRLDGEPELGRRLSRAALKDVATEHTWGQRARKVIAGLDVPTGEPSPSRVKVAEAHDR